MSDEEEGTVIYNGICRSYEKNTTSDRGDVVTSQRILALPLTQGQWTEETMPREGDRVLVDKGSFSEWGEVTDRYPGNLGTHIFWRYGRN